jgi:hypothetical protein
VKRRTIQRQLSFIELFKTELLFNVLTVENILFVDGAKSLSLEALLMLTALNVNNFSIPVILFLNEFHHLESLKALTLERFNTLTIVCPAMVLQ